MNFVLKLVEIAFRLCRLLSLRTVEGLFVPMARPDSMAPRLICLRADNKANAILSNKVHAEDK